MYLFTFWLPYFAPTLIAWYRKRHGMPTIGSVGMIFFINLGGGWTVIGWFIALAYAINRNPVGWFLINVLKLKPDAAGGPVPQGTFPMSAGTPGSPAPPPPCGSCGGSGQMICSSCGGRGSWYDQPTTASGMAQLRTCPACMSSGRIRCPSCGGSGRGQALIF